jgi:hypothetical protein
MAEPKWLDSYGGQTTDQLLALQNEYRTDSLVVAFDQAINQKAAREGEQSLSEAERTVLAVEALESEVNNGGYSQFFLNYSVEYAPLIVESLRRIGCPITAQVTQTAIDALNISEITAEAIAAAMEQGNDHRDTQLASCDEQYYGSGEPIADNLLDFIKANKIAVNL